MLHYKILPVTEFQQNCSLVWCDQTNLAALIDPGGDIEVLLGAVAKQDVTLQQILVTHGHIDHVGAVATLAETHDLPIYGPDKADLFWIEQIAVQSQMFNLPMARSFTPNKWLHEGDSVMVGQESLSCLHCPGHTPGHIVFFHQGQRLAFVGDVLFKGSIGRTDFPQGDHQALITAIKTKLLPLGDDITFIPGHGPPSTFGVERLTNPFLTP